MIQREKKQRGNVSQKLYVTVFGWVCGWASIDQIVAIICNTGMWITPHRMDSLQKTNGYMIHCVCVCAFQCVYCTVLFVSISPYACRMHGEREIKTPFALDCQWTISILQKKCSGDRIWYKIFCVCGVQYTQKQINFNHISVNALYSFLVTLFTLS